MTSRNQNKPPAPRIPANKNRVAEDAPLDKRRKVGNCRMMASTTTGRSRQPLAPVSTQKDVAVAPSETEGSECESIQFTKEEVDALLNERFKGKKFDSKGKQEWMIVYLKKLKVCIKWYQKGLEDLVKEKKNLCKMLDSSERKCVEAEAAMKVKEEELNATISTLETNVSSLKESLAKEESEKFDGLEYHKREKESRIAAEKNQDSLRGELGKAEQNASKANEKVKAQEDTSSATEGSECESIEFTKEEVDALLNERFKGKKFDSKGKQEWRTEYQKKLKVCIKWYQKGLEDLVEEKNNLCKMLDSSERKCVEAEAAMKVKEEELNATIFTLETNVSSLKESLAKEESEKFDALECHKREKESRIAAEKNQDSLREELGKAEQNASKANEKVKSQENNVAGVQHKFATVQ